MITSNCPVISCCCSKADHQWQLWCLMVQQLCRDQINNDLPHHYIPISFCSQKAMVLRSDVSTICLSVPSTLTFDPHVADMMNRHRIWTSKASLSIHTYHLFFHFPWLHFGGLFPGSQSSFSLVTICPWSTKALFTVGIIHIVPLHPVSPWLVMLFRFQHILWSPQAVCISEIR